jgi:hypothetical protein
MAGDLQRRHPARFRRPGLLVFEESRYFLPKSVHAVGAPFPLRRTMWAADTAGIKSPAISSWCRKIPSKNKQLNDY